MKKFAVLTSNMQIATANKHPARKLSVEKFLPSLIDFLQQMRQRNVPIIHLQLAYKPDHPKANDTFGPYPNLLSGSECIQILPEILEPSDLIIEKGWDSGFYQSPLDEILKELHISTLIITGMQAYTCVQFTAADAFFRGYEVIINEEAVGSTRQEDTDKALACMKKYCATLLSSDKIYNLFQKE